jgi:hypothetical protein
MTPKYVTVFPYQSIKATLVAEIASEILRTRGRIAPSSIVASRSC